jgi:hypothetical protein
MTSPDSGLTHAEREMIATATSANRWSTEP